MFSPGTCLDLVVALPFGAVSDRLGRKLILFLNSLANIVMFAWFLVVGKLIDPSVSVTQLFLTAETPGKIDRIPVEAMIAAPFLALFGGGSCVLTSTVFAYLTDLAPDLETRLVT